MTAPRLRLRVAIAILACMLVACAGGNAATQVAPQELSTGRFSAGPQRPSWESGTSVTLPHAWENDDAASRDAWYAIDWPVRVPADMQALYFTAITVAANVYVNGELVAQIGTLGTRRPRSFEQSQLVRMPADLVKAGTNRIALHVWSPSAAGAGVGAIMAGPITLLRERARADLFEHTLGPAAVSVATFTVGVFILALWFRRRDPAYALFGLAAMLWSMHTLLSLVPEAPLPQPHWRILWHATYLLFVALLCLFCVRFAGVQWRPYRRIAVAYAAAVVPVLYAADALHILGEVESLVRLGGIVIVLFALAAVARYAVRNRNMESALLLGVGAISTAFAVHDWIVSQNAHMLRPVWLVPYAALAFLTLVGYILTDRFVRALNEAERVNQELEQRVAEKSRALSAQLEETRAARDAAEAANRAKSRFLAAASHDLRQPLHALGMFSTALTEHVHDSDGRTLAQRIGASVSALEALFSALLDVSKLDAGTIAPHVVDMEIRPLLDRLVTEFAADALRRGLKLALVSGDVAVRSDPVLLERILRNLMSNALRYTDSGGVVIGCRRRGARCSIEVWDSGPGIAPAERERIFEEFYQIGNPARDRTQGLGLGLAIVRRIADLLGHPIELASRPGRGSVFRIIVPQGGCTDAHAHAAAPLAAMSGCRVLVIDDEEDVRAGTLHLLVQWGCEAIAAKDAAAAQEICSAQGAPDAMIVDYRLGAGADGLSAIALLREQCGLPIPAVLVSGESAPEDLARIRASGVMLLHKPVAASRLRSTLTFILAEARHGVHA